MPDKPKQLHVTCPAHLGTRKKQATGAAPGTEIPSCCSDGPALTDRNTGPGGKLRKIAELPNCGTAEFEIRRFCSSPLALRIGARGLW